MSIHDSTFEQDILSVFSHPELTLSFQPFFAGTTRRVEGQLTVFYDALSSINARVDLCHELGHLLTATPSQLGADDAFGFERYNIEAYDKVLHVEAKALAMQYHLLTQFHDDTLTLDALWQLERDAFLTLLYSNLNCQHLPRKQRLDFKSMLERDIVPLVKSYYQRYQHIDIKAQLTHQFNQPH